MEEDRIVTYAREIMVHCAKTTNCLKCPLFQKTGDKAGFCKIEGLLPWEWDIDEDSSQLDSSLK